MPTVNAGANTFMEIAQSLRGTGDQTVRATGEKGIYGHSANPFTKIKDFVYKFTNPEERTARVERREAKVSEGAAQIKDALTKSYGHQFAKFAFEKLGLTDRVTGTDVNRLQFMAEKYESHLQKGFAAESPLFLMAANKVFAMDGGDTSNTEAMRDQMRAINDNFISAGSQFEININYKDRAILSAAFQNIDTMSREGLLALREQLTKSTGEIDGLMRDPFGVFKASNDGDFDTEMILRNALEIGAVDEQELQELGYDTDLKPFKADLLQAAGIVHA